jgi:ATP-dependent helicase HrpA
MLEDKLVALLKSLPKRLRRQLVPIPDTVRDLLPEMLAAASRASPFWRSLCECVGKRLGESVKPTDFDWSDVPPHLRMRIETIDETGKTVESTRDLSELQSRPTAAEAMRATSPAARTDYDWSRTSIEAWDIVQLPSAVIETVSGVRLERFPTLQWIQGKLTTTVVDSMPLAEQMLREGLVRMFSHTEKREIRSQIQFLPQWTSATMWLSDRYRGDSLRDMIGQLIARLAFVETQWSRNVEQFGPCMRSLREYECLRVDRVTRIASAAAEIGRWLPRLADSYRVVRKELESLPQAYKPSAEIIQIQLSDFFSTMHACHTPWVFLREIPRYISAIGLRIERLRAVGSAKDIASDATAEKYWRDYMDRLNKIQLARPIGGQTVPVAPSGKLLEYRWMIEELRVSLHAQKLGTRVSVSPKRLDKLVEEIE